MNRPPSPSQSQPRSTGSKGIGATARAELARDQARDRVGLLAGDAALLDGERAGVADHEDVRAARHAAGGVGLHEALRGRGAGPGWPARAGPGAPRRGPPRRCLERIRLSRPHDQSRTIEPARGAIPARRSVGDRLGGARAEDAQRRVLRGDEGEAHGPGRRDGGVGGRSGGRARRPARGQTGARGHDEGEARAGAPGGRPGRCARAAAGRRPRRPGPAKVTAPSSAGSGRAPVATTSRS